MSVAVYGHIEVDERGVAWLPEARTRVREIVIDKVGLGHSPEEIQRQHPHLSLAQIHAALAYYYDHQREIDAEIEASWRRAEQMRAEAGPQRSRAEWEAIGGVTR